MPALPKIPKHSAEALWSHEGCGAGRFEPAELQPLGQVCLGPGDFPKRKLPRLSAIAWAGFYTSLRAPEAGPGSASRAFGKALLCGKASELPLPALEPVLGRPLSG